MFRARNFWVGLIVGAVLSASLAAVFSMQLHASVPKMTVVDKPLDARFPLAKTRAEVRLFAASDKSCNLVKTAGMKVAGSDGSSVLTGYVSFPTGEKGFAAARFMADGSLDETSLNQFSDAPPIVCYPADLSEQAQRKADPLALSFLVDDLGFESDGGEYEQFAFHRHMGSTDLSNVHLQVAKGLVVGYSDLGGSASYADPGTITYGLTDSELAALRQAVNPNN